MAKKLKRKSKRSDKGSVYALSGRAAEARGDFSTASVWYAKAAAAYGRSPRGRMWAARAKDIVTEEKKMGTLFQGNNNRFAGNMTTPKRGKRRIGRRHKRRASVTFRK